MVTKYVETAVDVDLEDFENDELIEELEARGYAVLEKNDTTLEDQIRDLREDFITWYQFGMKNENFEKIMKEFFKETIDEHIL